jgi:hypothetical protein
MLMKLRKDPPGYIGDDAVRERTEELVEMLRQKTGSDITLAQLEEQIKERRRIDPKLRALPRALALRLRAVRESRGMTRKHLSEAANLDVRHIALLERGRLQNVLIGDVIRLCLGLRYDLTRFVEEIQAEAERLAKN